MNEFILLAKEGWQWVLTWHWGWQTFAGLMVFSICHGTYDYFSKRTLDDVWFDVRVWMLEALAGTLNIIATILAIAAPIIMILGIMYFYAESQA